MLFTLTGFHAVCGIMSILGALAGPFLLYSLIQKAADHRPAVKECAALAAFGLAVCLWLWIMSGALSAF